MSKWYGRLINLVDALRQSYWFIPMAMTVLAAVAALAMVGLDNRMGRTWADAVPWIYDTSPEGARAVLSAVAGSIITVTGVVFSITIVAMVLAASQYGPRLLRNFLGDRRNQTTLGIMVATFLYSLLVLQLTAKHRVAYLATALAVVLAAASVFVLIYFLHHVASSIQAGYIIAQVGYECRTTVETLFPERLGHGHEPRTDRTEPDAGLLRDLQTDGVPLGSDREGYLRVVDQESLMKLAVEADLTVRVACRPGDFVARGTELARVLPAQRLDGPLRRRLLELFVIGTRRTQLQDVKVLIDELVELALRALSTGINDPQTAIDCVHRLCSVICAVAERELPSPWRFDSEGRLRVIAPAPTFDQLLSDCFDAIGRNGGDKPEVALALLQAFVDAYPRCRDPLRRNALLGQAQGVYRRFKTAEGYHTDASAERVEAAYARLAALSRPTPT